MRLHGTASWCLGRFTPSTGLNAPRQVLRIVAVLRALVAIFVVHPFSDITVKTRAKTLKYREKQRMIHVWITYDTRHDVLACDGPSQRT